MTNEEAKSELMQIYMSLSEEKKQALDVLMEQADVTDDDIATMRILFNADIECLCNQGRFNDAKEMEQIRDRLKARLQADGEYISREAVIDIIEDVCPIYENDYRYILREKVNELPTVAISSAEPKIVPIAEIKFDDDMLHEIVEEAVKNIEIEPNWIPVSERLPKEDNEVLITIKSCGELYVCHSVYRDGLFWQKNFEFNSYRNPIAWMPLPAPYEPQEISDHNLKMWHDIYEEEKRRKESEDKE